MGGGIAGLWSLQRLVSAGYDAILIEAEALGAGQTLGAQGILHGGVKYGLDGSNREIASRLRSLPPVWLDCLAGKAEPSLAAARTLSPCQHLWAADSWLAKVGATIGARAMQGEVRKLDPETWPAALREGGHKGSVYELEETVVEVKSVIAALAAPLRNRIFQARPSAFKVSAEGRMEYVKTDDHQLFADLFIFSAGTGNEPAAEALGLGKSAAQRRPLRQIMVKGNLPTLYGHCVTVTPKPVVTITSHPVEDGKMVWYLGGGVAEDGVKMTSSEAILNARNKLAGIFPKLSWENLEWSSWEVDRSEPGAAARLPDGPALMEQRNAALVWPTKMVYAPALADQVLEFVQKQISPPPATSRGMAVPLPMAEVGKYPWETAVWQNI